MNWRLAFLRLYLPAAVKRTKLRQLFSLTADALGCAALGSNASRGANAAPGAAAAEGISAAPGLDGLSYRDCLRRYALFTREQAEKALERAIEEGAGLGEVQDRLYRNARRFGEGMRRQLGIVGREEAVAAMRLLYRAIGIDLTGRLARESTSSSQDESRYESQYEVVIQRCFFSDFYSEEVCRVISALDAGVAAGISGGGQLEFCQRLTGGHDCCRAHLRFEGEIK